MAGMVYGQYLSQYDMRAAANPTLSLVAAQANQYLVGSDTDVNNDIEAANGVKMDYIHYNGPGPNSVPIYLSWIKKNIRLGYPVTICLYISQGVNTQYDHIATVLSYESLHDDDNYYSTDYLTFGDHIGYEL